MTTVRVPADQLRRPFNADTFTTLVGQPAVDVRRDSDRAWLIDFDPALTSEQEVEAAAWLTSANDVDQTLRSRAKAALEANRTFLAIEQPTQAQVLAQVRRLTRTDQALIRIALQQLDDTD